ncbi:MAG TPA: hypothetical protein VMS56_00125 [Thermoanaerobaculia bacterium]|nr:hypothetical protein [Thermoanaerobaculia bacterium]
MKHLNEDLLTAIYYGDAVAAEERAHFEGCAECRAAAAAEAKMLDSIRRLDPPEPEAGWEEGLWRRLEWRVRSDERRRLPSGGWLAMAASLVMVAFLAGRIVENRQVAQAPPGAEVASNEPAAAAERVYVAFVGDHLDRTQLVLLELSNAEASELPELSRRADELVRDNRLARAGDRDPAIVAFLDALEPLLIELSHASADPSAEAFHDLRSRLDRSSLLLRLRVTRSGLQERPVTSTRSL